ncbi:MAG: carboxypeptidase-like regulatory domain-containing protein [Candidatus Marinimicrobia bacterium]|nr:carboxypeptidase-like regulatory domain-containing protein [Candidatus Neomarinimicrobiota bacterium]MCF7839976.1 carboxypeptidase-like regulatory domain-containing protein [Candidatus Neomarinimicrobiota bacterium]
MQDAPRDNIFDPESELYERSGEIQGMVTGKYPPYTPIAQVRVELPEQQIHSVTNDMGEFAFSQLKPGIFPVIYTAGDYVTHQDTLVVPAGNAATTLVRLNGKPKIASVELITKHIAHWQPVEDEYVLEVESLVEDFDGVPDVDSVRFQIPAWDFDTLLTVGSNPGVYEGLYFDDAFGGNPFPELEGEPLRLRCGDQSGDWGEWYDTQISRLIVSVPQILSPAGLATVDSLPVFRWSNFDAGFQVLYQVDIFRLNELAIPQFVQSSPAMAHTTLQWQTQTPLAPARYYWTLSVRDRYGNISVSKEAAFMVQ